MNAEQFLSLADSLRSYAQHSGRDLNAANLFVHTVLMRAIKYDSCDQTGVNDPMPGPSVGATEKAAPRAVS